MAGNFNLTNFKSQLIREGGLSRGYYFECQINLPGPNTEISKTVPLFCRAATLPAMVVEVNTTKFYGKEVRYPGARTSGSFTLTFFNTYSYSIRNQFIRWQEALRSFDTNTQQDATPAPYLNTDLTLLHYSDVSSILPSLVRPRVPGSASQNVLGADGEISLRDVEVMIQDNEPALRKFPEHLLVGTYKLEKVFPSSISPLTFAFDNDEFQTFDIEFQYLNMHFIPSSNRATPTTLVLPAQEELAAARQLQTIPPISEQLNSIPDITRISELKSRQLRQNFSRRVINGFRN